MYKLAIMGKANSGKNTVGEIIIDLLECQYDKTPEFKLLAFADPIKEIVKIMFPKVQKKHLYGPSRYRNTIIKDAFDKNNNPLTIRQALLDIGTGVGRSYNSNIWLDNMDDRISKAERNKADGVIISDLRFANELNFLKKLNFSIIKVNRNSISKIDHISETLQDEIKDTEFDFIINNNSSLEELTNNIKLNILPKLLNI